MKNYLTSRRLVRMAEKMSLITLKLLPETQAEFAAAVKIFSGRSVSAYLHNFVVGEIDKARQRINDPEEFKRIVEAQKELTKVRSSLRKPSKNDLSSEGGGVPGTEITFGDPNVKIKKQKKAS